MKDAHDPILRCDLPTDQAERRQGGGPGGLGLRRDLDRYFNAFETGKMSEDLCRPRIEALAEKLRGLQSRHAELTAAMDDEDLTAPSTDELEKMRATVQHAIEHGPNTLRKAVLQQFVVEVRIESRRVIWPTFRLPLGGVRELSRMVDRSGFEPLTSSVRGRRSPS